MPTGFDHVETWIFDLDETLYPPSTPLFPQIERRMTLWIANHLGVTEAQADAMRRGWWEVHGTSLAGLMAEHDIDPAPFLADVHDVDLSHLTAGPDLSCAIAALPGRRIVHTNGPAAYADRVLRARGLQDAFHAVYGIETSSLVPKPNATAYDAVEAIEGHDPARAAMFEDVARNLAVPHARGTACVLVGPDAIDGPHVHHHTTDLAAFLRDRAGGGG